MSRAWRRPSIRWPGLIILSRLPTKSRSARPSILGKIEVMGGMLRAIERGFVQQEIQNAAYEYQQAVDRGEAVVVGVNRFEVEEEKAIPIQKIDPGLEPKQMERVRALRARRDAGPWQAALQERGGRGAVGRECYAADSVGG